MAAKARASLRAVEAIRTRKDSRRNGNARLCASSQRRERPVNGGEDALPLRVLEDKLAQLAAVVTNHFRAKLKRQMAEREETRRDAGGLCAQGSGKPIPVNRDPI